MKNLEITNEKEAKIYALGIIEGLNTIRLSVWGFGYDDDKTAQMIRDITSKKILEIKEILDIDYFGEEAFENVKKYIKTKEN